MNIAGVKPGDIVHVDKKGRRFHAVVQGKEGRELLLMPIERNISYRSATSREVCAHWRKSRQGSQAKKKEGGR